MLSPGSSFTVARTPIDSSAGGIDDLLDCESAPPHRSTPVGAGGGVINCLLSGEPDAPWGGLVAAFLVWDGRPAPSRGRGEIS
jgi:hypothetical protein